MTKEIGVKFLNNHTRLAASSTQPKIRPKETLREFTSEDAISEAKQNKFIAYFLLLGTTISLAGVGFGLAAADRVDRLGHFITGPDWSVTLACLAAAAATGIFSYHSHKASEQYKMADEWIKKQDKTVYLITNTQ